MFDRSMMPSDAYIASVLDLVSSGRTLDNDSIVSLGDIHLRSGAKVSAATVGEILESLSNGATMGFSDGVGSESLESLYALARLHVQSGHLEKGHTLLRYICVQDHLNPRNWLALGKVQLLQEKNEDALNSFFFGSLLDKDNPVFPLNSAQARFRMGELKEAMVGIEHAERLYNLLSEPQSNIRKEIGLLRLAIERKIKTTQES